MDIGTSVRMITERVSSAALRAGARPEDITILAASKMNGAGRVREAYDAGIRTFGENRVQEMEEKLRENAYEGARLHFIGHLQRNKVKNVTGRVDIIESVDSEELLTRIGRRAAELGITQDVLIEVNIGGEPAKSGVEPEKLGEIMDIAGNIGNIRVLGLMAIPPAPTYSGETGRYFDKMRNLFVDMSAKKYDNITMRFLSMGMSADFEEAIMAGANIVRIGSAIFGERHY